MNDEIKPYSIKDIDPVQSPSTPEFSNWTCYMFGGTPEFTVIRYTPFKGRVPNAFVRWMMKICFDCTWVKK